MSSSAAVTELISSHPIATAAAATLLAYYTYITFISKAAFDGSEESMAFRRHRIHNSFVKYINGRIIVDKEGMAMLEATRKSKQGKGSEEKESDELSNKENEEEGEKKKKETETTAEKENAEQKKKTTFLDSSKQYVFGLSPHHVASIHHHLIFSNGAGFLDDVYSGPKRSAVASILLQIPLIREYFLTVGCVDASRPTFDRMLRKGNSMIVLPGGIAEQLRSEYGHERVLLRKGFVRIAMENNVGLVPCYCFGESHLYKTSNFLSKFRRFLAEKFYIGIPIMWGHYGLLCPFIPNKNVPLAVVIGAPIDPKEIVAEAVAAGKLTEEAAAAGFTKPPKGSNYNHRKGKKAAEGSKAELTAVDVVFDAYVEELKRIFETYKAEAGYPNAKLELL